MSESARKVLMIATARQMYGGSVVLSNQPIGFLPDSEAADLVAINFARHATRAELEAYEQQQETATKDMKAADSSKTEKRAEGARNRYLRRDLRAKD